MKRGGGAILTFAVDKGTLTAKSEPTDFKLAGADGAFHPAMGKLAGNTVVVTSEAVPDPAKIRYAWANNPTLSLYDSNGLPCPPFEKDLVGN